VNVGIFVLFSCDQDVLWLYKPVRSYANGAFFRGLVAADYDRNCEKEPIGKELFRIFCATNSKFQQSIDFLDSVVSTILNSLVAQLPCQWLEFLLMHVNYIVKSVTNSL